MPMKVEVEVAESKAPEAEEEEDVFKLLDEDSAVLKRTAPAAQQWSSAEVAQDNRGFQAPGKRLPSNYVCNRCGKPGHNVKYCPTNGDPNFDPEIRLLNIPKVARRKVTSLDGIDITNKKVISYRIIVQT